jgi:hypothetical protein
MRRHLPTRLVAIAAMVAGGSLGSIALVSGTAGASAPTITCNTGVLKITGSGTISGCNDTANTGGKGTIKAVVAKKTGTITWNKTGTTTFKFTEKSVANTKCAKGDTEISETATTTGGTGKAVKSIPKGQVSTTLVCVKGSSITLVKGEKYKI